jgi:hypothetical protein
MRPRDAHISRTHTIIANAIANLLSLEYAQSINFMDKLKGLFGCTQIYPNPHGLRGIEVQLKLNFTSIFPRLRGLGGFVCSQTKPKIYYYYFSFFGCQ